MPNFRYRALNPRGRVLSGTLPAANELDLQQQLQQAGITLIESRVQDEKSKALHFLHPVRMRDLIQMCMHLEQLERAGVRVTDALRDITEATGNPYLQAVLSDVMRDVDNGLALSAALAKHQQAFPPLMASLIGAGETTGRLADVFKQLTEHFSWQERLRGRLTRASAYPAFTLIAMIIVIVFIMGYVIPQTTEFLYSLNIPLPAQTRALIETSSLVQAYWLPTVAIMIGIVALWRVLRKQSRDFAFFSARLLLRTPLLGKLIQKVNLARWSHTFAVMFASGIEMLPALETSAKTVSNEVLAESLHVIREQVQNGNPLSLAIRLSGEFPALVQRMLKIGEETGDLTPALTHVADYYERDVQEAAQALIGAVGPALTLVAGGLLMWMTLAVFVPIYDALPQLMR